jgi:hypothetical protein
VNSSVGLPGSLGAMAMMLGTVLVGALPDSNGIQNETLNPVAGTEPVDVGHVDMGDSGGGWLDGVQVGLDAIGVVDPFGIADGLNALIYLGCGQMGNAAISAAAIVPIVGDGGKIGKYAARLSKSLGEQAAELVAKNGGKARVTLRSPSVKYEVDLAGKAHGGVPTPHTKVSPRNPVAPKQPAYNTKGSPVRPSTQDDMKIPRASGVTRWTRMLLLDRAMN